MPLTTHLSMNQDALTISINGRFDFGLHQEFRQAYESANGSVQHYTVDLRQTEYLDSSALGMLLILRERAGGNQADITITHCSPDVKKILTIANFHKLFTID